MTLRWIAAGLPDPAMARKPGAGIAANLKEFGMADEALTSAGTKGWLYRPAFPDHWERHPLYTLAQWVNGLAFRDIQFSPTGKPVIKITEIKNGISDQTKFTEQVFDESVHVRAGDLLFSWSGQPETSIDVFWWRGTDGWLNQHSFRVTPVAGIDPTFFFYLLRYLKPSFVGIARNKQTTGLGHVTKRDLENIAAAYPPLPEQRAVAHILGALDDKIELNRRMNETLEAMARALFKSWFVDFDPVRAKAERRDTGLPKEIADLFLDSFEDSELGEIPRRWEVKTIDDLAEVVGGSTPSTTNAAFWDGGVHHWATPKDLSNLSVPVLLNTERRITDAGLAQVSSGLLPIGTVLVSSRAPIGYLAIAEVPVAINQGFIAMRPRDGVSNVFLLLWARAAHDEVVSRANGSTFLEISKSNFRAIPVVTPTASVMSKFEQLVLPLYERIIGCVREARTLSAQRDALLPKLISGELRVQDAESLAEPAE